MSHPYHRLVNVLASAAVLSLALLAQATAANAQGTWSAPTNIDGSNSLTSVSCPSASFCAAVDASGNALTYNGTSWSAPTDIDGSNSLTSVSCPSASFCAAVDESGNALTYNGSSWSVSSGVSAKQVSCSSAAFCVAIEGNNKAFIYNGSSWSPASDIATNGSPTQSVSCPSANFCTVVDAWGEVFTYNGSSWSAPTDIQGTFGFREDVLTSVSCSSATFCVTVDAFGGATVYNGSSWSVPTDIDGSNPLTSVSCESTTLCVAVGSNVVTYNGSSWTPSDTSVSSISCPIASFCVAVDDGNFLTYAIPPTTSVLIPSTGATMSGSTFLDASASNASSVEFRLLGGSYGFSGTVVCAATETVYGWLCPWNTMTVPNGSYTLLSEAFNGAGSTFSSGVSINVENPPTTHVLIPSGGASLSGVTYPDASASNATSVEFRLLGGVYGYSGPVVCTATETLYGWLCGWNTTTVPDGSYVLVSEAFNMDGSAFSSGVSITVKN